MDEAVVSVAVTVMEDVYTGVSDIVREASGVSDDDLVALLDGDGVNETVCVLVNERVDDLDWLSSPDAVSVAVMVREKVTDVLFDWDADVVVVTSLLGLFEAVASSDSENDNVNDAEAEEVRVRVPVNENDTDIEFERLATIVVDGVVESEEDTVRENEVDVVNWSVSLFESDSDCDREASSVVVHDSDSDTVALLETVLD